MRKIVKRDNRKKAFLGALIGGVASIAGSAIGAAKRRKVEREQLRQQQAALCLAYSGLHFGCTAACGYFCRGARPALAGAGAGGMLLCGHVRQCADRRPRGAQRLPAVERGRYGAGGSHRRKRRERRAVFDE